MKRYRFLSLPLLMGLVSPMAQAKAVLEEVIVTAQHRAQSVPSAVTK